MYLENRGAHVLEEGSGGRRKTQEKGAASQPAHLTDAHHVPAQCWLCKWQIREPVTPHPKELLAQWGKQTCSLQRTPGVMVMQWSVGFACGGHHRG